MNPTRPQMEDLASGEEVKLSAHHTQGPVMFHLTTAQFKKLTSASAADRGCTLRLTAAQVKHNAMHGEGVFSDIAKGALNLLKPVLRKGVSAGLNYGKDYIQGKIENATGIQEGGGFLDILGSLLPLLVGAGIAPDAAAHHIMSHRVLGPAMQAAGMPGMAGMGVGMKKQRGRGFLGDAAKGIGHFGVDFLANKLLGGSVMPNSLSNENEALRAALFQKKGFSGMGLYQ